MLIMRYIIFPITLFLVWRLKWSIIERLMLTITFLLLDCFIIPKWINSPTNILTEIISNVKILLVIAVVLGLILYISKKNRNYEQISKQEIEKLKLQAQRSQSISKLKTEYIATIKNLVLGLFLILFLFGIFLNSSEFYNPQFPKKEEYVNGYINKTACWVADSSDIDYLIDAINRRDIDYLNTLIYKGKVFVVDKKTQIEIHPFYDNVVMIYFLEGRYTGNWGYTIKGFAHKL